MSQDTVVEVISQKNNTISCKNIAGVNVDKSLTSSEMGLVLIWGIEPGFRTTRRAPPTILNKQVLERYNPETECPRNSFPKARVPSY
ncbi:hypothetical protein TNCV_2261461 [Trichonephila clavipes]|nr:hypothetical protein TNCV_2261461 [Trichonephila clavipes]